MPETLVVTTSLEKQKDVEKLARHLLQKRLIACAPQLSSLLQPFYLWKGL